MMSRRSRRNCCVTGCNNSEKECRDNIKFYSFPGKNYEAERKQKWIIAVNRKNPDGSLWQPTRSSRICSEHFISGKRSDSKNDPDYIPSIFPAVKLSPNDKNGDYSEVKKLKKIREVYSLKSISALKRLLKNSVTTQVNFDFDKTKFTFSSSPDYDLNNKNNKIIECNIGYNVFDNGSTGCGINSYNLSNDCEIHDDECIECDGDDDDNNHIECKSNHNIKKYSDKQSKCIVKTANKSCGPDGLLLSEVLMDIYHKRHKF